MKIFLNYLMIIIILGCSAAKKSLENPNFEIVKVPLVVDTDTIYVEELRFYNIRSAMDGIKLMYRNYEQWDQRLGSKHQTNINRMVWESVELIDGLEEKFTVIADGAETRENYYACLMVFDSNDKNCFDKSHPYRDTLTFELTKKMSQLDHESDVYQLFKN